MTATHSLWIAQLDNQYRAFFVKLVFNHAKTQFRQLRETGMTYRCNSLEQSSVEFTAYQWNDL
jgi:hypothetical protein